MNSDICANCLAALHNLDFSSVPRSDPRYVKPEAAQELGIVPLTLLEVKGSGKDCDLCRQISKCVGKWLKGRALERPLWRISQWNSVFSLHLSINDTHIGSLKISEFNERQIQSYQEAQSSAGAKLRETTLNQIQWWLKQCFLQHEDCREMHMPTGDVVSAGYPSRLLEIDESAMSVRLRSTADLRKPAYVTLSHCWGKNPVGIRLLSSNRAQFESEVPLKNLSLTFRETIKLVSRLKYRFLWIDALCIIQDSTADWVKESAVMGRIYQNGTLNIAATMSQDGNGGLFSQATDDLPSIYSHSSNNEVQYLAFNYKSYRDLMDDSALDQRGWVLQERLMSPRTIHFVKGQVIWECCTSLLAELVPDASMSHQIAPGYEWKNYIRPLTHEIDNTGSSTPKTLYERWQRIVTLYTARHLTMRSDKLVAVSGLAQSISVNLQAAPKDYLAGLWMENLQMDLLWYPFSGTTVGPDHTIPSWSWAKVDGTVEFVREKKNMASIFRYRVLDASTERSADAFGAVSRGRLRVQGPLLRVEVLKPNRGNDFDFWGGGLTIVDEPDFTPVGVTWDDSKQQAGLNKEGSLILLMCRSDGRNLIQGLILRPTKLQKGEYTRVGIVDWRFKWMNMIESNLLPRGMDQSNLDDELYLAYDEIFGFSIDII